MWRSLPLPVRARLRTVLRDTVPSRLVFPRWCALSARKLPCEVSCRVVCWFIRWPNLCGTAGVFWELQPAARQCSRSQQTSQGKIGSDVRCGVPVPGRSNAVTRVLPRKKAHSSTSCAVVPLVSAEWSHSAVCNVKGCSSLELCILSFCVAMSTRAASCL